MAFDELDLLAGLLADESDLETALAPFCALLEPAFVRPFLHEALVTLDGRGVRKARPGDLRIRDEPDLDMRARIAGSRGSSAGPITTLTRHTLIGNAGPVAFAVRRWQQTEPLPNDVFDPHKRLERRADVVLVPGEAIALRAAIDGYAFVASEQRGCALIAAGAHVVPFAWNYDAATGRPIRLTPVRKEWLYLQEVLRLAEIVGDASLGPGLTAVSVHPSHFVRWAAARTAQRIAPDIGRDLCLALTNDPHPHVRAAARSLRAGTPA